MGLLPLNLLLTGLSIPLGLLQEELIPGKSSDSNLTNFLILFLIIFLLRLPACKVTNAQVDVDESEPEYQSTVEALSMLSQAVKAGGITQKQREELKTDLVHGVPAADVMAKVVAVGSRAHAQA